MIGRYGGSIMAILFESNGLFAPLFASAALNFAATIALWLWMIEPDGKLVFDEDVDEESEQDVPEEIDWCLFFNINMGALWDNIGR